MGKETGIEWTDATVNFWVGCHKVSSGCKNCYMFTEQNRYGSDPNTVRRCKDGTFLAALKWKEPKKIFTCSWSDFFIEEADPWRADAFNVIRKTPQHSWQILTKRPERILQCLKSALADAKDRGSNESEMLNTAVWLHEWIQGKPPKNVWMGTTVEEQKQMQRVIDLVRVPAFVHFVSCEPLLSELNFSNIASGDGYEWDALAGDLRGTITRDIYFAPSISWVICGGESGPHSRPMHPDWARKIRDDCAAANVPFLFKQWGEWAPIPYEVHAADYAAAVNGDGKWFDEKLACEESSGWFLPSDSTCYSGREIIRRVGKKAAGRLLDGVEHNGFPQVLAEVQS